MAKLAFTEVQKRAEQMVNDDQARVGVCHAMRDMFQMEWSGEPKADWVRRVVSPDAYDAAMGVLRLMMAAEPQITVASSETTVEDVVQDDVTERGLRAVLHKSDAAREISAVYDAALSATLFGEIVMRVGYSADVADLAQKAGNKALAEAARQVPFTIETLNPAGVYTESDAFGTRRVVIVEETTVGAVREFWGKLAAEIQGDEETEVELRDYWDREWRCVYVREHQAPILLERHELPFIPVVRRVVQGTGLWTRDDGARVWPLLYAMYQSGMWDAQNISLTMVYSLAYAMGSVPFIVTEKDSPNLPDPDIDWSRPGVNATLPKGVRLNRLALNAIPDEMLQVLNLVESKTPEMLMPKVVFGQAPSGSMSFSAINLLSQGGRLPLVPIQERLGDALAAVCEIILRWAIEEKSTIELYDGGILATIDPQRLQPERLHVSVSVTPDVPQDRVQVGALVSQLVASGVISRRTGREWMHVVDDTGETEQILLERFIETMAERFAQMVGARSDQPESLEAGAEPEGAEGPLFDPSAGGLPPVMLTGQPEGIEPLMPGGAPGMPGGGV